MTQPNSPKRRGPASIDRRWRVTEPDLELVEPPDPDRPTDASSNPPDANEPPIQREVP